MSKMVSARVPDAVYEQACAQLADLGSSPTELINAAFEYVVQERRIPKSAANRKKARDRKLTTSERKCMSGRLAACTLDVDIPADVSADKKALADARVAKHEALA